MAALSWNSTSKDRSDPRLHQEVTRLAQSAPPLSSLLQSAVYRFESLGRSSEHSPKDWDQDSRTILALDGSTHAVPSGSIDRSSSASMPATNSRPSPRSSCHPAISCLLTISYYCTIILIQYRIQIRLAVRQSRGGRWEQIESLPLGVYTENVKEGFRWSGSLAG